MSLESQTESAVAEHEVAVNPEKIWGGDESEWANWRTAAPEERNLDLGSYMTEQKKVIFSKESRDAYAEYFAATYGSMPMPEPTEETLVNFFLDHGGSIYFKRRTFWRRRDIDFKDIKNYYENRLWEKETKEHAVR